MLRIDNIAKSYGGQVLFEEASLQFQPRERVGLVGRNGSGKTTLFKMILGEVEADEGNIIIPSGYRIGHVAQHLKFTEPTLLDEGCLGLLPDEIHDRYKVEAVLFGLGFSKEDMDSPPETFSGGYQVRLNLAKVLVSHPNLLLLDEPTNYLDIVSLRWIVKFLREWKHELMIISHDREFMDSITTHTAMIHRQRIRKMPGDTAKLYAQIEQDEEVYEKTRQNEEKQRKHMEAFVERFKAKASKAAAAQSRVKMMEKLPKLEALAKIADLDFKFQYAPIEAKRLVDVKSLQFGYDPDKPLIRKLDMVVQRGDRIAVIGKNGRGKSTLIKLLAEELTPQQGTISSHLQTRLGYFGQTNIDVLVDGMTVEEEVSSANLALNRTAVRSICGSMMFSGELAEKKISVLSGGEKSRVMLGKIIAMPSNLLLLDEPTNHLDMQSIDALIEALETYDGAVVIVTHSEMILRSVATKLVVFQDGEAMWFDGTYDDFLRRIGWRDEVSVTGSASRGSNAKKVLRQQRAAVVTERSQLLKPLQDEIEALEARIVTLETEESETNSKLLHAAQSQHAIDMAELAKNVKRITSEIDTCFSRLEVVYAESEKITEEYAARLAEVG